MPDTPERRCEICGGPYLACECCTTAGFALPPERLLQCPRCHGVTRIISTTIESPGPRGYDMLTVTFSAELTRCDACDDEWYTFAQSMACSDAFRAAMLAQHGITLPRKKSSARRNPPPEEKAP